jgi:phospholipase A1
MTTAVSARASLRRRHVLLLLIAWLTAPGFCQAQTDSGAASVTDPPSLLPTPTPVPTPAPAPSALERRMTLETQTEANRFVITPHKPNYLLPFTYNSRQRQDYAELDKAEVKYQLSFKLPLSDDLFGSGGKLAFGYTQISFWQLYNKRISSPFRETDYEPELMLTFAQEKHLLGFINRLTTFGINHQSNGRSVPESRSWNRLYVQFTAERDNLYLIFKPWYRLPENAKTTPQDSRGDDNPDIQDYLGHGELTAMYLFGHRTLAVMWRSNFQSAHRGALQVDWSEPLQGKLRGYVQYFNGYGESLIDYNRSSHRLGIGVMLTDWL